MKTLLLLLGLSFLTVTTLSKNTDEDIIVALQAADAEKLTDFMDNMIDLKLPDNVNEITNIKKTQAGVKLKTFFSDSNISGFDLISKRKMGDITSITGTLKSSTESYKITLMLKEKAGNSVIITLRVS